MAYSKKNDEKICWNATEMLDSDGKYSLTWAKDCDTLDKVAEMTKRLQQDREVSQSIEEKVNNF